MNDTFRSAHCIGHFRDLTQRQIQYIQKKNRNKKRLSCRSAGTWAISAQPPTILCEAACHLHALNTTMERSRPHYRLWMHSPPKAVYSPNSWMNPADEIGA